MPEFSLRQFLTNFDELPEDMQPITGHLVRKLDPEVILALDEEMKTRSPVRRRRGALAAGAMGLVRDSKETEQRVRSLLNDEDHVVRAAAATVLAGAKTVDTWEALRDAMFDRSVIVQEAAEQSLQEISRFLIEHSESEEDEADSESEADPTAPEELERATS